MFKMPVKKCKTIPLPREVLDISEPEDIRSIKGNFGWEVIGNTYIPYILKVIDGETLHFISTRMAENNLLSNYLKYIHEDNSKFTFVVGYLISESEANLLNHINKDHTGYKFGEDEFLAGKDYIVRLDHVREFYLYIKVCYSALVQNNHHYRRTKCGFIKINSETIVPYCIKDNKKYIPVFSFKTNRSLKKQTVQLNCWELMYLKLCCKIQGIKNEAFYDCKCCDGISLDEIKKSSINELIFEEYWPTTHIVTNVTSNQISSNMYPWFKPYSPVTHIQQSRSATENILPQSSPAPTTIVPPPVTSTGRRANSRPKLMNEE